MTSLQYSQELECVAQIYVVLPFCQTVRIMDVATKGASIMDTQKVLYTGTEYLYDYGMCHAYSTRGSMLSHLAFNREQN